MRKQRRREGRRGGISWLETNPGIVGQLRAWGATWRGADTSDGSDESDRSDAVGQMPAQLANPLSLYPLPHYRPPRMALICPLHTTGEPERERRSRRVNALDAFGVACL